MRWFDAGAGCLLLATCAGPAVSVYARVPGSNDFGVHSSRSSVTSPWTMLRHRLFHANVSACAWTARGESLVVGVGREVLALGSGAGLAMALATEAAPAREYHPSVLLDWLARGEVGRARLAARHALAHLRAIGDGKAGEGSRGGLAPVPIAELVAEGDRVESKAEANVPIDFDAAAFGFGSTPKQPKAANTTFPSSTRMRSADSRGSPPRLPNPNRSSPLDRTCPPPTMTKPPGLRGRRRDAGFARPYVTSASPPPRLRKAPSWWLRTATCSSA